MSKFILLTEEVLTELLRSLSWRFKNHTEFRITASGVQFRLAGGWERERVGEVIWKVVNS